MHFRSLSAAVLSAAFLGAQASNLVERSSVEVCAEVKAFLKVPNSHLHGLEINVGYIDACLCISDVPYFVSHNLVAEAGVLAAGTSTVISIIEGLINNAYGHQTCHFPDHADPQCKPGYPCFFDCKDGFTPSPSYNPTKCICKSPYIVCNGICGNFHHCPSGHPKREVHLKKRDMGCRQGLTACGVYGRSANAWECIDTQADLESCGGCVVSRGLPGPAGTDCTTLPGVSGVSCTQGKCVIKSCDRGYKLSWDKTECLGGMPLGSYDEPASDYGLDHVPLGWGQ